MMTTQQACSCSDKRSKGKREDATGNNVKRSCVPALAAPAEHKQAGTSLKDAPPMQLVIAKRLAVGTQPHVNYQ